METSEESDTDVGVQLPVTREVFYEGHTCPLHITFSLLQHLLHMLEAIFSLNNGEGDGFCHLLDHRHTHFLSNSAVCWQKMKLREAGTFC